jgi:O-antigen ligase
VTAAELARAAGAVDGAAAVALLLMPWGTGRVATMRRAFGLGLLVVSWLVLTISLVPSSDIDSVVDRLSQPVWAVAAAVGVAGGLGICALLVRLILARPWIWFALVGLALPVRVPVPVGGESRNLLLPLYVMIVLGVAAWVWGRLRGRLDGAGETSTPVDIVLAAFMCFSLVSLLWSSDVEEAAVKAVFFYIPFVLLYRLVLAWWRHADAPRALAAATIGLAVPVAVLALFQYATKWTFWNDRLETANVYGRFFRVNGIFFDPNILGRYLVVAIVVAVAVMWVTKNARLMVGLGVACAVLAAGTFVTFSRSSALALILALTIMAWRAFGWKRVTAVGGGLAVVLSLAAIVQSQNIRRALTDSDRLEQVSEGRFDLVKGGLEVWADTPVVGAGLGSFARSYEQSLTPEERRKTAVVISHNAPVTILTETGLAGFGLFLVVCFAGVAGLRSAAGPGARVREQLRDGSPDIPGWVAWTALALMAGIMIHSLLYAALIEDPYTWVVLAAGLAVGRRVGVRQPAPAAPASGSTQILPATG